MHVVHTQMATLSIFQAKGEISVATSRQLLPKSRLRQVNHESCKGRARSTNSVARGRHNYQRPGAFLPQRRGRPASEKSSGGNKGISGPNSKTMGLTTKLRLPSDCFRRKQNDGYTCDAWAPDRPLGGWQLLDVCRSIGGYPTLTDFAKVLKDGCRFDNSYIGRCTAVLKMRTSLSSFTFLAVAFVLCRPAVSVAVYGQCGVCIP